MSESYERERQNNSRLDELAGKVSALRGVTIDIYDNARDQGVIDSSVCMIPVLPPIAHCFSTPPSNFYNLTERSLLQLQHLPKRQCRPPRPHGKPRKQSRDTETREHHRRRLRLALLYLRLDLWGFFQAVRDGICWGKR